jgi:hypothetical protein
MFLRAKKVIQKFVSRVGSKRSARCCQKIHFSNANTSGHRQDTEVLLMVLNFPFALVSWRKLLTNYLLNFVFSVHLNFGYFSAAKVGKKSFLPLVTGSF